MTPPNFTCMGELAIMNFSIMIYVAHVRTRGKSNFSFLTSNTSIEVLTRNRERTLKPGVENKYSNAALVPI